MLGKLISMFRILVIDDDREILAMLKLLFEEAGYGVVSAENGIEGVSKFIGETPDVVITDISMPHMDGLETIQTVLSMNPKAKIIAMSGAPRLRHQSYLSYALKFGAIATIEKPFLPADLLKSVKAVVGTNNS